MSLFRYRAIAANGDVVQGEMEASNQGTVIERLRAMGHMPVAADEVATGRGLLGRALFAGRRIVPKDLELFTSELATLLGAGLPLAQALQVLIEVSDKPRVARLLEDLLGRVRDGASLADAMAASCGQIPRMHVSIVRAGEAGGTLDHVLDRLATYMEKARSLREGVKSALIYPMILLLLAATTIVLLVTFVVPEFQPLFEEAGQDLPLATRVVVALADVVAGYWWAILLVVLLAFLLSASIPSAPGAGSAGTASCSPCRWPAPWSPGSRWRASAVPSPPCRRAACRCSRRSESSRKRWRTR